MVIFFLPFSIALIYPLSISSARQMSPCDIPFRFRIFLMLSPSFLLINIIIAYEILHFQTILNYNAIYGSRPSPLPPIPFQKSPPQKIRMETSGKARGRDARYSARGGIQRVATRSGRTMWYRATTHAERAKSGVLLEVGSDF